MKEMVLPLKLLKSGGAREAPMVTPVPPTLSSPFVLLLVTASSFEGGGRRSQTTEPFLKEKYKKKMFNAQTFPIKPAFEKKTLC